MSEQMRKEFEVWAVSVGMYISIDEDNEYKNYTTWSCWKAWQASRAAIVVELPLFCVDGVDAAEYRDDVIAALDKAGVSYE